MSEKQTNQDKTHKRVLGDEWSDWDGSIDYDLENTKQKLFLLISVISVFAIISTVLLFFWLIHPRLLEISPFFSKIVQYCVLGFGAILILWLSLFIVCSIFNLRLFAPLVLVPKVINFVLNLTLGLGKFLGIPKDRIINSFLKVHNLVLEMKKRRIKPHELLVLLPRCLRKDCLEMLRNLKEKYEFQMFTVGGGTQARSKIRSIMPRAIIAIACERDLLNGFVEVNPKIPVVGFPNSRPQGPCLNTEIDISQIESTIRRMLNLEKHEIM
jgi:uncharacterized protein